MPRNYAITLIVLLVVVIGIGIYFAQNRTGTPDTDADRPRVSEDADTGRLNPQSPADSPTEGTRGDQSSSRGMMDRSPDMGAGMGRTAPQSPDSDAGMSTTTPPSSAPNTDMGTATQRD